VARSGFPEPAGGEIPPTFHHHDDDHLTQADALFADREAER
jgi:hypothetical protein